MSATHTTASVHTLTQTATHLTDVIMGTIADILADLRMDVTTLYRDWNQDEAAIKNWLIEQALDCVILECHRPDGTVDPVIEFPVRYNTDGSGNATFTADRASLARYRAKLDRVPTGTVHRLFCTFRKARSPQPGWSPGNRASTDGLTAHRFGALGRAPDAQVEMRYLHS